MLGSDGWILRSVATPLPAIPPGTRPANDLAKPFIAKREYSACGLDRHEAGVRRAAVSDRPLSTPDHRQLESDIGCSTSASASTVDVANPSIVPVTSVPNWCCGAMF